MRMQKILRLLSVFIRCLRAISRTAWLNWESWVSTRGWALGAAARVGAPLQADPTIHHRPRSSAATQANNAQRKNWIVINNNNISFAMFSQYNLFIFQDVTLFVGCPSSTLFRVNFKIKWHECQSSVKYHIVMLEIRPLDSDSYGFGLGRIFILIKLAILDLFSPWFSRSIPNVIYAVAVMC